MKRFTTEVISPTDLPNLKLSDSSDIVETTNKPITGVINSDNSNIYSKKKVNCHQITRLYNPNKDVESIVYITIHLWTYSFY